MIIFIDSSVDNDQPRENIARAYALYTSVTVSAVHDKSYTLSFSLIKIFVCFFVNHLSTDEKNRVFQRILSVREAVLFRSRNRKMIKAKKYLYYFGKSQNSTPIVFYILGKSYVLF